MRRRRSSDKKKKAVMIASSVLVLGALTVTGLYIYQAGNTEPKEEYQVEMAQEEESSQELAGVHEADELEDLGELDYAPLEEELDLQQVGNSNVKNQQKTEKEERSAQEKEETQNSDAGQKEQALAEEDVLLKVGASGVVSGNDAAYLSDVEEQALEEEAQAEEEARVQQEMQNGTSWIQGGPNVVSGNGFFTHPCPGYRYQSSYFGEVRDFDPVPHKGHDYAADAGTPTYAAAAGRVTIAGWSSSAGNWVVIDHGNGLVTKYMHHSALCVTAGQYVEKGQQIGAVGTTGYSTGNHLHFQVELNGVAVNPDLYM